jgi:hypothetical protein
MYQRSVGGSSASTVVLAAAATVQKLSLTNTFTGPCGIGYKLLFGLEVY